MHKGIGGTSLQIEIDNTPVFVKKVPLTDLELQPENYMSTANIFNLPMGTVKLRDKGHRVSSNIEF